MPTEGEDACGRRGRLQRMRAPTEGEDACRKRERLQKARAPAVIRFTDEEYETFAPFAKVKGKSFSDVVRGRCARTCCPATAACPCRPGV